MKQKIYILGLITTMVIFTGTLFKVNHFPGAGILLTLGIFTLVMIFLSLALINHYRYKRNRQSVLLYVVTWLTCFVVFTAMLFKIQHWPGAGFMLLVALPFPYIVFLPVFIRVTSQNKNFNIYNTVIVLFLLASNSVFSTLLALNVSRTTINDSLDLSANYNRVEQVLRELVQISLDESEQEPGNKSALLSKTDEVLAFIDECQLLLYKTADISEQEWVNDPKMAANIDSKQAARSIMLGGLNPTRAERLETGLKSIVRELETIGYSDLAELTSSIFELTEAQNDGSTWGMYMFANNYLSWALIYLDSLEVNILSLKAEISSL